MTLSPSPAGPTRPGDSSRLHAGIVYGPVRSRRFGRSLGVNLLPPGRKTCSFNCLYCQYGWTDPRPPAPGEWPRPDEVATAVRDTLRQLQARGEPPGRITLAGHGEPTLHPLFNEVVDALLEVRDEDAPGTPVGILSNSTTAHRPDIRTALLRLDHREMKLDAGTQDTLRRVNATAHPLDLLVDALARLPHITVQSMFVREAGGRVDNSTPAAVEAWAAALARIRPDEVHIYTIARRPAWDQLVPVDRSRLEEIARVVRALDIVAHVFA